MNYHTVTRSPQTEAKTYAWTDDETYEEELTSSIRSDLRTYLLAFGSSIAIVTAFSLTCKILFLT